MRVVVPVDASKGGDVSAREGVGEERWGTAGR
jgi:hypothetical protein